jgi:hypothetical protein
LCFVLKEIPKSGEEDFGLLEKILGKPVKDRTEGYCEIVTSSNKNDFKGFMLEYEIGEIIKIIKESIINGKLGLKIKMSLTLGDLMKDGAENYFINGIDENDFISLLCNNEEPIYITQLTYLLPDK